MGDPTVTVTPWNTAWTAENPNGQFHDALWDIAAEQATLQRMQTSREDFETAFTKVSSQEVRQHLDVICDDNGFRRLDGSGNGRNPHWIDTNERIKVRIDPNTLTKPAPGINDKKTGDVYGGAVMSHTGRGTDLVKKQQLDAELATVPGFNGEQMSPPLKQAWIGAHSLNSISAAEVTALGNKDTFNRLDQPGKTNVLTMFGRPDRAYFTGEINKIVGAPMDDKNVNKLRLLSTAGLGQLPDDEMRQVVVRYDEDGDFRAAIDKIVQQDNFKNKPPMEQAHALSILGREKVVAAPAANSGGPLTGNGYLDVAGKRDPSRVGYLEIGGPYFQIDNPRRTLVIEKLYNDVLASADFKLGEPGASGKETPDQRKRIDDFAKNAHTIK
jgi:hypothetical protein